MKKGFMGQVIGIFTRNHIYLAVPITIKCIKHLILLALQIGEIGEILRDNIYHFCY